ncbi:unnamed protein product [Prorocentrum cordatum]|uniref:Uncharacterized protein n=1 Tax=Prorocentrum cordatum TaxID=2364126 RepID=A0ABN9T065_9DINO|nr:unnamed protein product [Polarella glacialis]
MPTPDKPENVRIPTVIDEPPVDPAAQQPRVVPEQVPAEPRNVYIRRNVELAKYGFTDGCPGCLAARTNASAKARSSECRERIQQAMANDPELAPRVFGAAARQLEAADRAPARQEGASSGALPQAASPAEPPMEIERPGRRAAERRGSPAELPQASRRRLAVPGGPAPLAPAISGEQPRTPAQAPATPQAQAAGPSGLLQAPPGAGDPMDADSLELCALLAAFGDWRVAVSELYGPGRLTSRSSAFDPEPGTAYDIRTGYDFSQEGDRQRAQATIELEQPLLITGSPMRAPWSNLQALNVIHGVDVNAIMERGVVHLVFCAERYKEQIKAGRLFLHEQPASSRSWRLWMIREIAEMPGVHYVECDQCAYGLWCTDAVGPALVKKPTGWLTNSAEIARELTRRCPGCARHCQTVGLGRRGMRIIERYPPKFVAAVLRGLRREAIARGQLGALEAGPHLDEPPIWDAYPEYYTEIVDNISGAALDPELVAAGRKEEMEFLRGLGAEVVCLNRVFRWTSRGDVELEADSRHAFIMMQQLNLWRGSKALSTPGVKAKSVDRGRVLEGEEATRYRSLVMRASYLSEDRPDIKYAVKEAAKYMHEPCEHGMELVKRIARYLLGVLKGFSDSDFAGCLETRKSTSCGVFQLGDHMIRVFSATQGSEALSSGEAEWYALVHTASCGIGLVSLARDMGYELELCLAGDATAASGIAHRRGAGRIRHIETNTLWLQRHVTERRVILSKTLGKVNVADLGTKHLAQNELDEMLGLLGFFVAAGKSDLSLAVAGNLLEPDPACEPEGKEEVQA